MPKSKKYKEFEKNLKKKEIAEKTQRDGTTMQNNK